MPNAGQSVEGVVNIAALAVAGVGDAVEVAVEAVGIVAAVQRSLLVADGVGFEASLVVVGIFAEQQTLLAIFLTTELKLVSGKSRTVEVDGAECAALGVVIIKFAVVRQAQVVELAAGVVAITQSARALVLGDEAVLSVVFEFQRMVVAIIDADQSAEAVVAVFDLYAVGYGFDQQAPGRIPFVT